MFKNEYVQEWLRDCKQNNFRWSNAQQYLEELVLWMTANPNTMIWALVVSKESLREKGLLNDYE